MHFRSMPYVCLAVVCACSGFADQRPGRDTLNRPDVAENLYFIVFHDGVTAQNERAVEAAGARIEKRFLELRAASVRIAHARQIQALQSNARVEYVEPVPMRYVMGLGTTQLEPATTNGLYGLVTSGAVAAHARGVTGTGINLCVADGGLDTQHPDIAPNYAGGIDTVGAGDNDPDWNNDTRDTHGTHVAGTVLARSNTVGVLGVAHTANLYHARVLGPRGGTGADVMQGVWWLVSQAGCKVVNLSLGGPIPSTTEQRFYAYIRSLGSLVVAASGNNGSTQNVSYPAAYSANIAVGAVDRNNVRASFSNAGAALDVVAPGVDVLSSVPENTGSEASVTTNATHTAFGMQYAGNTASLTGTLVNCGLGMAGECPAAVSGNIALILRGTNSFGEKVLTAMNAGAVAAIIYNNVPGDLTGVTLGTPTAPGGAAWIPAVGVSDIVGATLLTQVGSAATVVKNASSWDHYSGTSMASPHVTGVAGLIWSVNPSFTATQVLNFLLSTTTDLGTPGLDNLYGRGLVNADAAVAAAQAASP